MWEQLWTWTSCDETKEGRQCQLKTDTLLTSTVARSIDIIFIIVLLLKGIILKDIQLAYNKVDGKKIF